MVFAYGPGPERRASEISQSEIELARAAIAEAAVEFDGIEDGESGDWRRGFEALREAAKHLGNLDVLDYLGI